MWRGRNARGLMLGALHGELSDRERKQLERALASSRELRDEFESLRDLVGRIPRDRPEMGIDLLPILRSRLEEGSQAPGPSWKWRWATATLCLVVVAGLSSEGWRLLHSSPGPEVAHVPAAVPTSHVLGFYREASALMDQRDFGNAFAVLQTAIDTYPDDPDAGRIQQTLADLCFEEFRWYPQAYEAYLSLRRDYPESWLSNPRNADRLDLLDEARRVAYASLHLLDSARNKRGDPVGAFEEVIARYPATQVASVAAAEMAESIMEQGPAFPDGPVRLKALEQARDRCSNPIAVARFNIEIARAYWTELNDPVMAHELARRALEVEDTGVIELAQSLLRDIAGSRQ